MYAVYAIQVASHLLKEVARQGWAATALLALRMWPSCFLLPIAALLQVRACVCVAVQD